MDFGAVVIAALGGIVLYFVFSVISNFTNDNENLTSKDIEWDDILSEENTEFEDQIIYEILIPNNINPEKFINCFMYSTGKTVDSNTVTKSMNLWGSGKYSTDERYHIYYYSGFPDVLFWAVIGNGKDMVKDKIKLNSENIVSIDSFNEIVKTYKNVTGRSFELSN